MRRMVLYLGYLVPFLLGLSLTAQGTTPTAHALILEGVQVMDQAYDHWNRVEFEQSTDIFQQAIDADPKNYLASYWKGAALFYLASYFLHAHEKEKDSKQGAAAVAEGIRVLTQAIDKNSDFSESYALRGVLRGMNIQLNPWSVLTQGPAVETDRKRALALNADNPRVHYLTGVSLWMAPEIFGGGGKEALKHFLKAEELYAIEIRREKSRLDPAWGYSTCLSFIGDVYAKQGERKEAYQYYQKALFQNAQDLRAQEGLEQLARVNKATGENGK
jgi:tetratricopeptide (TPR) repeat protein